MGTPHSRIPRSASSRWLNLRGTRRSEYAPAPPRYPDMPTLTITAGLTGWYGHVTGADTDTEDDLLAAATRLHTMLQRLSADAPRRAPRAPLDASDDSADTTDAPHRPKRQRAAKDALNADGRAALDILIANPDAKCADIIGQIPGGARTLRWLDKHGYTSFDTRTQLHTVLRTE